MHKFHEQNIRYNYFRRTWVGEEKIVLRLQDQLKGTPSSILCHWLNWSPVGFSTGTQTILTEVLRGSYQSLQINASICLKLGQDRFLPDHFQFFIHEHPIIRRYNRVVKFTTNK
jgi:hypothetical protein